MQKQNQETNPKGHRSQASHTHFHVLQQSPILSREQGAAGSHGVTDGWGRPVANAGIIYAGEGATKCWLLIASRWHKTPKTALGASVHL